MFDCKGCNLPKQDEEEYKWRPNWCKDCAAKSRKEYRDKNIEKYREIARRSVAKHGDKYAQRSRCYTAALRDLREAHKEEFEKYYEKHLADLNASLNAEQQATPVIEVAEMYDELEEPRRYAIDL